MRTSRKRVLAVCVLILAMATVVAAWSAEAQTPPFSSTPVAGNLAALTGPPVFLAPGMDRVPGELRPGDQQVHALGDAGYVWPKPNMGYCVLMRSGAGGCLAKFDKPAVLYLTGVQATSGVYASARVEGVVPDSIVQLVLIMDDGTHVPAPISSNGFSVSVPNGAGLAGYIVTLASGRSFEFPDPVRVPDFVR